MTPKRPLLEIADLVEDTRPSYFMDTHRKEMAEVLRAADAVIEELQHVVAYDGEHDIAGYRVCCQVMSFKPHSKGCPVLVYQRAVEAWEKANG